DEAVADAARCAQSGVALHDFARQLVGVKRSLRDLLGATLAKRLDRERRRGLAVKGLDDFEPREVEPGFFRDGFDRRAGPDEQWGDESIPRSVHRSGEGRLVTGIRNRRWQRQQCLRWLEQALVLLVHAVARVNNTFSLGD